MRDSAATTRTTDDRRRATTSTSRAGPAGGGVRARGGRHRSPHDAARGRRGRPAREVATRDPGAAARFGSAAERDACRSHRGPRTRRSASVRGPARHGASTERSSCGSGAGLRRSATSTRRRAARRAPAGHRWRVRAAPGDRVRAAVNAGAAFPAASTMKAAVLVEAARRDHATVPGALLDRMILPSDDRAANEVLARLGGGSEERGAAAVTATLRRLGLRSWLMRRGYLLDGRRPLPITPDSAPELRTNVISTPYELAQLMVAVHRGVLGRGGVRRVGIGQRPAGGRSPTGSFASRFGELGRRRATRRPGAAPVRLREPGRTRRGDRLRGAARSSRSEWPGAGPRSHRRRRPHSSRASRGARTRGFRVAGGAAACRSARRPGG